MLSNNLLSKASLVDSLIASVVPTLGIVPHYLVSGTNHFHADDYQIMHTDLTRSRALMLYLLENPQDRLGLYGLQRSSQ